MADYTLSGMDAIFSALDTYQQNLTEKADQEVQGAGIACEAGAKQACPVDTGRLRASITYAPDHLACTVGTNVSYAPYVELGTSRQSAQPYLFPAFTQAAADLQDALKNL